MGYVTSNEYVLQQKMPCNQTMIQKVYDHKVVAARTQQCGYHEYVMTKRLDLCSVRILTLHTMFRLNPAAEISYTLTQSFMKALVTPASHGVDAIRLGAN